MLLLKAPRLLVEVTRVGRLRGCLSPNWQAAGVLAVLLGALVAQVAGAAEPERVALQGYGLRSVELAQGRLWTPSSASRPLPPLPPAQAQALHRALQQADLPHLPPPLRPEPRSMAKLSEPYTVTLIWADHRAEYAFDSLQRNAADAGGEQARRLLPLVHAVMAAVAYLDTPPMQVRRGRFAIEWHDGQLGVAVDAWNLYRPLEPSPLVEALRPYVGRRFRLEIGRDRDRPGVFLLLRLLQSLPSNARKVM